MVIVMCALAGCARTNGTTTRGTPGSANSGSSANEKRAVLKVWREALDAVYEYSAEGPPAGFLWADTPDLYENTSTALMWVPDIGDYETGQALKNDVGITIAGWAAGVTGPTTYSLGNPTVTMTSPTTATVESCVTSVGWSDPSQSPPPGLDGWPEGGEHLARNFLVLVNARWLVTEDQFKAGVTRC